MPAYLRGAQVERFKISLKTEGNTRTSEKASRSTVGNRSQWLEDQQGCGQWTVLGDPSLLYLDLCVSLSYPPMPAI